MNQIACHLILCSLLVLTGCAQVDQRESPQGSRFATQYFAPELPAEPGVVQPKARVTRPDESTIRPVSLEQAAPEPEVADNSESVPIVLPALEPISPESLRSVESHVFDDERNGYTLSEMEQLALGNNPAISAAQATTGVSAGLYHQVGTKPNSVLGYFGQQLADRNTDQNGFFIEREFVRGDKLAMNRRVLAHTNRAQQMEVETQRFRVLTDVRVRFFEALAAQQQFEATVEFTNVAEQGVNIAEQRQDAQEGSLVETLQARTLLSEVTLAAEQAEVAYHGAWRDLAAIAGVPQGTPVRLAKEAKVPRDSLNMELAYAEIISQSPELAVAQAIVCEKRALVQRQKVQAVPNVTGQLGVGHDRATNHGMINVQLSLPLPVNNRNTGNISAAYHEYVRATHEVQRIKKSIRSRLARTIQDYETALAAVRKYENEIVPQAEESLKLSETAYRAGELEFLQVLILRRSFYDSAVRLIQAEGELAQAAAKMDGLLLTGGLDSPQDFTDGDGLREASFGGQ